jgi:hypothetical protein
MARLHKATEYLFDTFLAGGYLALLVGVALIPAMHLYPQSEGLASFLLSLTVASGLVMFLSLTGVAICFMGFFCSLVRLGR